MDNKDLNYILSCIEKSLDDESGNAISDAGKRVDAELTAKDERIAELTKAGQELHDFIDLYVTWGDHYGETDAIATVEKSFDLQNLLIKLKEALQKEDAT